MNRNQPSGLVRLVVGDTPKNNQNRGISSQIGICFNNIGETGIVRLYYKIF